MELKYNYLEQIFKGMPMNAHTARAFRMLMQFCEDKPVIQKLSDGMQEAYERQYSDKVVAGSFTFRGSSYTVLNNDNLQCYELIIDDEMSIYAEPWNYFNPEVAFVTQLLDLEINEKGENHVF